MTDQEPIFRAEAVEASKQRIGAPVRPVGLSSWALTLFMAALVIAVAMFVSLVKFARVESISGSLEPVAGAARVTAPRSALVTAVHVVEGQEITADAPLFTLGSDAVVEGGTPLGRILEGVSENQAIALQTQGEAMRTAHLRQAEELRARGSGFSQRLKRLSGDLELARQRLALNEATLASYQELRQRGYASEIRYRSQQAAVLDDQRVVSSIAGEIDSTRTALAENEATLQRLEAEARQSLAGLDNSLALLEERRATAAAQMAVIVPAPKGGRVTLQAREGSSIAEGGALAIILPPGAKLKAQLWAPSRAAGFMQIGDEVRLRYDAFPYERFGAAHGRIIAIASAPTNPRDLPLAMEATEGLYRVDVELEEQVVRAYERDWPLAVGSRVTADVVLESRSLLSWVVDPLRAVKNRQM